MNRVTILLVLSAAAAPSQEKVTVPLSNPSQPVTLKAHLRAGTITITGGSGNQLTVESQEPAGRSRGRGRGDNTPPGMHRIDLGGAFNVEEDRNVVTISSGPGGVNLVVSVPLNTSLEIKTLGGGVNVTGVNGDLDVEGTYGPVTLKNVSGSVVTHTLNGPVTVNLDHPAPGKPMSFTSLNGRVDVTLPADTKASLRLKTTFGAIYSDFDVKMTAGATSRIIEDGRGQGGRYRIRPERSVSGSINGGGPEYTFQTLNGTILIHKR